MKRGATREEVIRATQDLITRNGIRAVRVDEIAQMLGISKRTLYEMFADKNSLVNTCLESMSRETRQRISANRRRRSGNPLQRLFKLMSEYIDNLCQADHSFLQEIRQKLIFAEFYDEHQAFWHRELTADFELCRKEELLLPKVESTTFAGMLMNTLLELRLKGAPREEICLLGKTILRGIATRQGIEFIDRKS